MSKKSATIAGALVSVELAMALKEQFGGRIGTMNLFRCPQCHQRLEVQREHFEHANGAGPCPLSTNKPK